ncbi:YmdB family metallophosphoesterase, partial [bacterium]|nr:YmdB family metallophosphoesterase [bacterium]
MRVLFIGDIFAGAGRKILAECLPLIFETEKPDFVVANAENAAGGKGLTGKTADEIFASGVDVITLGDHAWDRREIFEIIDDPRILRPLNLPEGNPGRGMGMYTKGDKKLCVAVLMGRTFIEKPMDCPF